MSKLERKLLVILEVGIIFKYDTYRKKTVEKCIFMSMLFRLKVRPSVRPSVHPSVHPSFRPSIQLSIRIQTCFQNKVFLWRGNSKSVYISFGIILFQMFEFDATWAWCNDGVFNWEKAISCQT